MERYKGRTALKLGPKNRLGNTLKYSKSKDKSLVHTGDFQLLDLIIPELKSHVIPYKFKSSHWLKLQYSDWRANLVKDFFYK